MLGGGVDELEGDELEAALLEAGDDVADDAALDAIGLNAQIALSNAVDISRRDRVLTLTMM